MVKAILELPEMPEELRNLFDKMFGGSK